MVDIVFDTSKYSITYKESSNLDYKNHKIHRNYNRWVANLNPWMVPSWATRGEPPTSAYETQGKKTRESASRPSATSSRVRIRTPIRCDG